MRNKQKILFGFTMAILPFLAFSLVSAEDGENTTRVQQKPPVKQNMSLESPEEKVIQRSGETQKSNVRENMEERIEKTKAQRIMAAGSMIKAQIRRAEEALERLGNLLERVETRREKLASTTADLKEADALIAKAKLHQTAAKTAIAKAKEDSAKLDGSETPGRTVQAYITSFKTVKKELIGMHRSLMDAVKAMRKSAPKPEDSSKQIEPTEPEGSNN